VQVGDLVKETSKMDRKRSIGLVLGVRPCASSNCECGTEEYLVHFFDDNDKCWMGHNFVEVINETK